MRGERYSGIANLFGSTAMTTYMPFRDLYDEIIRTLDIGCNTGTGVQSLGPSIVALPFGQTGYVFVMINRDVNAGQRMLRPPLRGETPVERTDTAGNKPFVALAEQAAGRIAYDWAGPDGRIGGKLTMITRPRHWSSVTVANGVLRDDRLVEASAVERLVLIGG